MAESYMLLFIEFFKTGLFAIGGGYTAIPFLYFLASKYNWFTYDELTNMIAVSNITPGPVGINMATYAGYTTAGFIGAVISTVSIILAPFITALLTVKLFNKFQTCIYVNDIFTGLKPSACALLAYIAIKLSYQIISSENFSLSIPDNIDVKALFVFFSLIIPFSFLKKNPLLTIAFGAFLGILIKSF